MSTDINHTSTANEKDIKIRCSSHTKTLINTICKEKGITQAEVVALAIQQYIAEPFLQNASQQLEQATQQLESILDPERLLSPKAMAHRPLVRRGNYYLMCDEDGMIEVRQFKGSGRQPLMRLPGH